MSTEIEKRVRAWADAWEKYVDDNGPDPGSLFDDCEYDVAKKLISAFIVLRIDLEDARRLIRSLNGGEKFE